MRCEDLTSSQDHRLAVGEHPMCVVIAVANSRRSVPQLELLVMHFISLYEIGTG